MPLGGSEATAEATGEPDSDHVCHCILVGYVGTKDVSEILPGNAHLHATSRETIEPAARGDEHCWPYTKSPILYNRPCLKIKLPDRHACGSQCCTMFAYKSENPKGTSLQAINNTSIPTHGTCLLKLNLGLRCTFRWV